MRDVERDLYPDRDSHFSLSAINVADRMCIRIVLLSPQKGHRSDSACTTTETPIRTLREHEDGLR
jgi:hypothetical protein